MSRVYDQRPRNRTQVSHFDGAGAATEFAPISFAAALSTTVPLKKSGLTVQKNEAGFV